MSTARYTYYCFGCRNYSDSLVPGIFACPHCGEGFVQELRNNGRISPSEAQPAASGEDGMPALLPPAALPLELLLNRFTHRLQQQQDATTSSGRSGGVPSQFEPAIGFSIQLVPIMATSSEHEPVAQSDSTWQNRTGPEGQQVTRPALRNNDPGRPVEFVFRIDRDSNNRPHLNVNLSPHLLRAVLENQSATQQALNRSVNELIALFGSLMVGSDGTPPVSDSDLARIPIGIATQEMIDEGKACSICLDLFVLNDPYKELPCHHQYHTGCIDRWLLIHGNCPICRTSLSELISPLRNIAEPD